MMSEFHFWDTVFWDVVRFVLMLNLVGFCHGLCWNVQKRWQRNNNDDNSSSSSSSSSLSKLKSIYEFGVLDKKLYLHLSRMLRVPMTNWVGHDCPGKIRPPAGPREAFLPWTLKFVAESWLTLEKTCPPCRMGYRTLRSSLITKHPPATVGFSHPIFWAIHWPGFLPWQSLA